MKQRGRNSGSNLTLISRESARPAPPESLTAEMAGTWHSITSTLPAEFFDTAVLPLLESYVRHIAIASTIDTEIAAFDPAWLRTDDGLRRYSALLALRERQTSTMLGVARSLRLTNQSRYGPRKAATMAAKGGAGKKPWE